MAVALGLYRPQEVRSFDKRALSSVGLQYMNREESRETALFHRFIMGDDAAFSELYSQHNQRLFNYCAKITNDHPAAEDIAQTVWERIIEVRSSLGEVINPLGFFYRMARNLCYDHIKHQRFQSSLDAMAETSHPVSAAKDLMLEEEIVLQEIETLADETKEIFILHYYSGYSFEEIAELLDKKPNAIWTKVSRARKELKQRVERRLAVERRISDGK